MSDVRSPRGALVWVAAVGIVLAGAASSSAATSHLAAASSAPKASAADADVKEISNYKLTMDAVRKFAQASRTMKQLEKKHPDAEEDAEDSDDSNDSDASDDDGNSESLADTEAKLASVPEARKAIQDAGLSVHEFVVITFALLQSAIAQYAIEQGADPAKIAKDAGIHPANVTFYKEHKAEIDALNADMK